MNRKERRRAASKPVKMKVGDVISVSGVTVACHCGCGLVAHYWFLLPAGMSREQAFARAIETRGVHGPFETEARVLKDQRAVLFGKDCKITAGGMWDPAWDRVQ